ILEPRTGLDPSRLGSFCQTVIALILLIKSSILVQKYHYKIPDRSRPTTTRVARPISPIRATSRRPAEELRLFAGRPPLGLVAHTRSHTHESSRPSLMRTKPFPYSEAPSCGRARGAAVLMCACRAFAWERQSSHERCHEELSTQRLRLSLN